MIRLMLAGVSTLVMFWVIPAAQPGSLDFGREVQGAECDVRGTQLRGRAEKFKEEGTIKTYESVTISFPGAAMTLRADKIVYDEDQQVMEAFGRVLLNLDTPDKRER